MRQDYESPFALEDDHRESEKAFDRPSDWHGSWQNEACSAEIEQLFAYGDPDDEDWPFSAESIFDRYPNPNRTHEVFELEDWLDRRPASASAWESWVEEGYESTSFEDIDAQRGEPSGEEDESDAGGDAEDRTGYDNYMPEIAWERDQPRGPSDASQAVAGAIDRQDWPEAIALAIREGWRDPSKLTNLLFFARHPELGGRRLDPADPNFRRLSREWKAILKNEVWPGIEKSAKNTALAVSGKDVAAYRWQFSGKNGARFRALVERAAQLVDLNPGLLASSLLAEIGTNRDYLKPGKVSSYRVGVDDFYDRRHAIRSRVPAYAQIGWDKHQQPRVHDNDAKTKKRKVKTIDFDSGPDALLASAVYLKYGEIRLTEKANELGGDFGALSLPTRWALIRMAMNAGVGGAAKRLKRALAGEDILVRNWAPRKIYQTDRNSTIHTARALHLSDWVFGINVTSQDRESPFAFDDDHHESESSFESPSVRHRSRQHGPGSAEAERSFAYDDPDQVTGEKLDWLDLEREPADDSEPPEVGFSSDSESYPGEGQSSEENWYEGEPPIYPDGMRIGGPSRLSTLETLLQNEAPGFAGRILDITAFALGPELKRGDRGSAVKILQQLLIRAGARIARDGIFGAATAGAVSAFQRRVNILPSGIADLATKAALALWKSGPAPSTPSTAPAGDLGHRIAQVAEAEWRIWHNGGTNLRETQPAATPHLQRYYREGVNGTVTASQLQSPAWQAKHPWSAVFISYCMRAAGAGSTFRYSRGHYVYVAQGKRNRLQSNTASPFWTYRPTEVAPEIGDLVCAERAGSGATYDNIDSGQIYATHCDIVTEVQSGRIRVIGGNVRNDVGEKWLRIGADGRLDLLGDQSRFYAVLRCRGAAPVVSQRMV